MASVSGRVTSSFSGEPLNTAWEAWVDLSHEDCCCQQDQLSEADAADGKYRFSGVCPGNYTVSAWAYGYQSESASISVPSGASATHDFALDPVAANIAADVTGLDAECGSFTGGYRQVKVAIRYQEYCHYPQRLVVWAYSALTGPVIIYDNGTSYMDFYYLADPDVTDNPAYDGYDTTYRLSFGWDTRSLPNTSFTLKAYLRTGDPHGDGTDIDPDPNVEQWVHEAGTPPDGTADGTAGGTTVTTQVKNIVITSYQAANSPLPGYPQDAFLYDPDGTAAQANPTFSVTIDHWRNEPLEILMWLAATAWGDTRPIPDLDPYVALQVSGPGAYTLAWDGTNPGYPGWTGNRWGTWTFDVDAYVLDAYGWATDHFYAKTHDGRSDNYDTLFGDHSTDWTQDDPDCPVVLRCTYEVHSDSSVEPDLVGLVAVDPELAKRGVAAGGTELGVVHDSAPPTGSGTGPGIATWTTTNPDETAGTWRVVLLGSAGSGADLRRDGTNPRILATNKTYERGLFVVVIDGSVAINSPSGTGAQLLSLAKETLVYGGVPTLFHAAPTGWLTRLPDGWFQLTATGRTALNSYAHTKKLKLRVATLGHWTSSTPSMLTPGKSLAGRDGTVDEPHYTLVDLKYVAGELSTKPTHWPTPVPSGTGIRLALTRVISHELGHCLMGSGHCVACDGSGSPPSENYCIMAPTLYSYFYNATWRGYHEWGPLTRPVTSTTMAQHIAHYLAHFDKMRKSVE